MEKKALSEQLRLIIYSLGILGIITVIAILTSRGLIAYLVRGINKNYNILFSVFLFGIICWFLYKKCIKNIIDFAEVKFLAVTTLIMFLVQLFTSYTFNNIRLISAADLKIAQNVWKFIIGLIPIVFSIALCQHFWRKLQEQLDKGEFSNSIYPTLMVAQGTFYTFLGVSVILFTYDSSRPDVNSLLAGLKMAFLTSVIGLLFSIAAKLHINSSQKEWIKNNPKLELNRPTVTEEDIYNVFITQNDIINIIKKDIASIKRHSENQANVMGEFVEAINKAVTEHMQNTYEFQKQCMEENLKEVSESMIKNINTVFSNMTSSIDTVKNTCIQINENLTGFNSNIESSFDTFAKKLQTTDVELDKINEGFRKLNSACLACSDDIISSINNVANNLKSNSDKLQDYILSFDDLANKHVLAIKDTASAIKDYNDETKACIAGYKENTDKMLASLNNACRNLAENTEQYGKAQATVAEDIQKVKELVAITQNYSQILPRTKLEIDEAKKEIINHYNVIDKFIQDRNAEFNTKMENAYLTHADNLNGLLNASLTIISDVLKAAQDNYMSNLAKMENEIEDLRKEIRRS